MSILRLRIRQGLTMICASITITQCLSKRAYSFPGLSEDIVTPVMANPRHRVQSRDKQSQLCGLRQGTREFYSVTIPTSCLLTGPLVSSSIVVLCLGGTGVFLSFKKW